MKDQYVGDIGDYGKYGLLRFMAAHGIKIGVNWYLTENDGSADGKITSYLKQDSERIYDPELFDALKKIANRSDKNVKMIEQAGLIPEADFYREFLRSSTLEPDARKWNRRLWFNNSTLLLKGADLIFADPDNGISYSKTARTKDSEKFILPEEVCEYYNRGQNVVFYCHKGRRKQEAWEQTKIQIREYIRDAQILAVTCHRGTQRSYIFVLHPDCYYKYEQLLDDFLASAWGRMFTWESVDGNAASSFLQLKNKFRNGKRIKIAVMTFRLRAVWVHSLKEKRMIVKSLIAKLQNRYPVSAAEVDEQDTHQIIVIGVAAIVPHKAMADSLMDDISRFVEDNTEAEIIEEEREIR